MLLAGLYKNNWNGPYWTMMQRSDDLKSNQYFTFVFIYHLVVAILLLVILYLVAAYLWEKVKQEKNRSRKR